MLVKGFDWLIVALPTSGLIFCSLRIMNKRNITNMTCKIHAKFDDLFQKVKDTLFSENFTLCLKHKGRLFCIKAVCCDNIDALTYVLTGETAA